MLTFIRSLTATLLLGFAALSVNVSAQGTPDGVTPAVEDVCDVTINATKGLYGLCVAYCEAIDAPENVTDPEVLASLKPAPKHILDNYNKKRVESDPLMPCVAYDSPCPAWTTTEIEGIGYNNQYSITNNDLEVWLNDAYSLTDEEIAEFNGETYHWAVSVVSENGEYKGIYLYTDTYGDQYVRITDLNLAQFEFCEQQILDHEV